MEVCVSFTPASQDKSNNCDSALDPCLIDHCNLRDLSGNDLETCLSEFLNIKDNKLSASSLYRFGDKNAIGNVVREEKQDDLENKYSYISAYEKCLSQSATFPHSGDPKFSVDGLVAGKEKQDDVLTAEVSEANGCGKSVNQHYPLSVSLPKSSKLVSAMKGSREKQGGKPKNLSVTWDPDVYDPVPTAASHVPSNKNHRHRNDGKKYGKNKLKGGGKSSRGSKSKDKKQVHKNTGCNKVKSLRDDRLVGFSKPETGIEILLSGVHSHSVEVVF